MSLKARWTCGLALVGGMALIGASTAVAGPIYEIASTGVGAAEAELFTASQAGATGSAAEGMTWEVKTADATGYFSNATGGKYIRTPNNGKSGTSSVPLDTPYVEYVFRVPDVSAAKGNYYVWLRGNGDTSNNKAITVRRIDYNNAVETAARVNMPVSPTGFGAWTSGGLIHLNTAGDYRIRLLLGDDGAGVDKIVLQRTSYTAPTGEGPAASPIPEPASALVLLFTGLMARRQR